MSTVCLARRMGDGVDDASGAAPSVWPAAQYSMNSATVGLQGQMKVLTPGCGRGSPRGTWHGPRRSSWQVSKSLDVAEDEGVAALPDQERCGKGSFCASLKPLSASQSLEGRRRG
jgi:hypothetical protein